MLSKGQRVLGELCAIEVINLRSQIGLVLLGRHVFFESPPSMFECAILMEFASLGAVQRLDMHLVS